MVDFQKKFSAFYEQTKAGTGASGECFYYGFAVCGNKVFCREGYRNAKACLNHLEEVKEQLKVATDLVGEGGLELSVIGPKSELDALKGSLGPLGTKFFELEKGGLATFY